MKELFLFEGKSLNIEEIASILKTISKKQLLFSMGAAELRDFYLRLFQALYFYIKQEVEKKNYRVVNISQGLLSAKHLKLISELSVWGKAEKWCIKLDKLDFNKEELIEFIEREFMNGILDLKINISKIREN